MDKRLGWLVAAQVATVSTSAPRVSLGGGASESFPVALVTKRKEGERKSDQLHEVWRAGTHTRTV